MSSDLLCPECDSHEIVRLTTLAVFKCQECGEVFEADDASGVKRQQIRRIPRWMIGTDEDE